MAKIWMCEDLHQSSRAHKFGERKTLAEGRMAVEYGLDFDKFHLLSDDTAKEAVEIEVPDPVAETLLNAMR